MIMDVQGLSIVQRNVENGQPEVIDAENGALFEQGKLLPPPIRKFHDREELLQYVHSFSLLQGYATTIRDSKKDQYVTLGCDKGGSYRNRTKTTPEERKRKSSSRLINCPFQIKGVKLVDGSWALRIKSGEHNHEASNEISDSPSFHQFSKEEIVRIKEMSKSGMLPRKILTLLRPKNPKHKAHEEFDEVLFGSIDEPGSIHKAQSLELDAQLLQSSGLTSNELDLNIKTELRNLAGSGGPSMIGKPLLPSSQNVVSFSPYQDMEPLLNSTGVSVELDMSARMRARTMEEKIDYAILLMEEQAKNTKAFMSKIDELEEDNLDLRKKLELALAELEARKMV